VVQGDEVWPTFIPCPGVDDRHDAMLVGHRGGPDEGARYRTMRWIRSTLSHGRKVLNGRAERVFFFFSPRTARGAYQVGRITDEGAEGGRIGAVYCFKGPKLKLKKRKNEEERENDSQGQFRRR